MALICGYCYVGEVGHDGICTVCRVQRVKPSNELSKVVVDCEKHRYTNADQVAQPHSVGMSLEDKLMQRTTSNDRA